MTTTTRGLRIQGDQPLAFLRKLQSLQQLIDSIGQPCWASGHTAAALLGFDGFALKAPFHVTIPRSRRVERHGHLVHRARSISRLDASSAMGVPCLSATRVLIDLAATETPRRLTVALDSALRDGLTSDEFLHRRLVELRSRGRSGCSRLLSVIAGSEASRGGHSYLERAFLELVDELAFPTPLTQQVLAARKKRLVRVDCHFAGTNVVVELLGYQWHRTPMQLQNDSERLNRLQLDGFLGLQFTYTDVVTRSARMLAELHEALG